MNDRTEIRKNILECLRTPDAIYKILTYINNIINFILKESDYKNNLLDSELIYYGRWWWVSDVYLFCKDNGKEKEFIKHLHRLNLTLESAYKFERYYDGKNCIDELVEYLERTDCFYPLITNRNDVIFALGTGKTSKDDRYNYVVPATGNSYYINIRKEFGWFNDFITLVDIVKIDQIAAKNIIKLAISELVQHYKIENPFRGAYYCIESNTISKDSERLTYYWQIEPAINIDIIYDMIKNKFRIVILPLLTTHSHTNTPDPRLFAHFEGAEFTWPVEFDNFYFEPVEFNIGDNLLEYADTHLKQDIEKSLLKFREISENLRKLLQTAVMAAPETNK
jgi:hypothetical protein